MPTASILPKCSRCLSAFVFLLAGKAVHHLFSSRASARIVSDGSCPCHPLPVPPTHESVRIASAPQHGLLIGVAPPTHTSVRIASWSRPPVLCHVLSLQPTRPRFIQLRRSGADYYAPINLVECYPAYCVGLPDTSRLWDVESPRMVSRPFWLFMLASGSLGNSPRRLQSQFKLELF